MESKLLVVGVLAFLALDPVLANVGNAHNNPKAGLQQERERVKGLMRDANLPPAPTMPLPRALRVLETMAPEAQERLAAFLSSNNRVREAQEHSLLTQVNELHDTLDNIMVTVLKGSKYNRCISFAVLVSVCVGALLALAYHAYRSRESRRRKEMGAQVHENAFTILVTQLFGEKGTMKFAMISLFLALMAFPVCHEPDDFGALYAEPNQADFDPQSLR